MIFIYGVRIVIWYNFWYCGIEGNFFMFLKIDWCKLGILIFFDLMDGFKVLWCGKIIILII